MTASRTAVAHARGVSAAAVACLHAGLGGRRPEVAERVNIAVRALPSPPPRKAVMMALGRNPESFFLIWQTFALGVGVLARRKDLDLAASCRARAVALEVLHWVVLRSCFACKPK